MRRTMPFSLIGNASRASRHASSAAAAARGLQHERRSVGVQRRRRCREHVAVDGLDRGDAFEQQVDARAARLALVALVDAPPHALRVAVGVAVAAPSRRRTRPAPPRGGGRRRRPRRTTAASSSSATASAVAPVPSTRPARRRTTARSVGERAGERARARELAARERGRESRPSADDASRSSAACSVSSATGSKSMRWQRDRIVGSRSSAPTTRAR